MVLLRSFFQMERYRYTETPIKTLKDLREYFSQMKDDDAALLLQGWREGCLSLPPLVKLCKKLNRSERILSVPYRNVNPILISHGVSR